MQVVQRITPCLWFDDQAEPAVQFYTAIFSNSRIGTIARYGEAGHEFHGKPAGTVMTVAFELDGQSFTALNCRENDNLAGQRNDIFAKKPRYLKDLDHLLGFRDAYLCRAVEKES
jgi:predicted 3-demethylubiquinone-9 3-methyltransferase (glyoxalase superfamily)